MCPLFSLPGSLRLCLCSREKFASSFRFFMTWFTSGHFKRRKRVLIIESHCGLQLSDWCGCSLAKTLHCPLLLISTFFADIFHSLQLPEGVNSCLALQPECVVLGSGVTGVRVSPG